MGKEKNVTANAVRDLEELPRVRFGKGRKQKITRGLPCPETAGKDTELALREKRGGNHR